MANQATHVLSVRQAAKVDHGKVSAFLAKLDHEELLSGGTTRLFAVMAKVA